jgi:hypothetical protein
MNDAFGMARVPVVMGSDDDEVVVGEIELEKYTIEAIRSGRFQTWNDVRLVPVVVNGRPVTFRVEVR